MNCKLFAWLDIMGYYDTCYSTWWRHQIETFSALLAICTGNSPVTNEFPSQRPVTRSFDVFFDLCLNKRLSKQWWGWLFQTSSRSLWRHCYKVCFTGPGAIVLFITPSASEHDGVIKWKHFPRYWPFSPHKGQWRGSLMISLICAWINMWVNNR